MKQEKIRDFLYHFLLTTAFGVMGILVVSMMAKACFSEDIGVTGQFGVGVGNSATASYSETKAFNLGVFNEFGDYFVERFEAGGWTDTRKDLGRSSSFSGNYSLGVRTKAGYLYVATTTGVGYISSRDSLLGGHAQFFEDAFVAVQGDNKARIGVDYRHISSAGLAMPNVGRDFLMLRIELPF